MTFDRIFYMHQRCKEITRLHQGWAGRRLVAGMWASLTGWRIFLKYSLFRPSLPDALSGEGDIVVSLTSFPSRIGRVWMVIDLLMRQHHRPAQIFLCLREEEFPDRKLPDSLIPYLELGLCVIWTSGPNMKSHYKYLEAFRIEREGQRHLVVTVDDDNFYAPDTLQRLMDLHLRFPNAVCCNAARRVQANNSYNNWPDVREQTGPSKELLALGYSGVLYPPSVYERDCFYDLEIIQKKALGADDLWLRYCEDLEGIGVAVGPYYAVPPVLPTSQHVTLSSQNVAKGRNDRIWKELNR